MQISRITSWICLTCLALATTFNPAYPQPVASEYAVKAAILYKITKFVAWPEHAFETSNDRLSICLADDSPFSEALQTLHKRPVRSREIEVITYQTGSEVDPDCHVLFVDREALEHMGPVLSRVSGKPILTIGDHKNFSEHGGIISLAVEQNRVSFLINVEASEASGLDISAQLLQLATVIRPGGRSQ